jgi:hypothetical protein
MSTDFTDETLFIRNTEIFSSKIDDEIVMMDEAASLYFALNAVAASIWTHLTTPTSVKKLHEALLQEYEVEAEQCQKDLLKFLTEMHEHKLINRLEHE